MGGELISRNSRKQVIPGPLGPLAAVIDAPRDRPPRAWALLCHGFGSFKEFKPLAKIAQGLIERGWGALRFDFAGLGASGGEFAESSFHTQQDDVRSVHGWMRESGCSVEERSGSGQRIRAGSGS